MPVFIHKLVTEKTCRQGNTVLVSFKLPAGSYIVTAKAEVRALHGLQASCSFVLSVSGTIDAATRVLPGPLQPDAVHQIHLVLGVTLATDGNRDAQFQCSTAEMVLVDKVVVTAQSADSLEIKESFGDPIGDPD